MIPYQDHSTLTQRGHMGGRLMFKKSPVVSVNMTLWFRLRICSEYPLKFCQCVNGDGTFDWQKQPLTHSILHRWSILMGCWDTAMAMVLESVLETYVKVCPLIIWYYFRCPLIFFAFAWCEQTLTLKTPNTKFSANKASQYSFSTGQINSL